MTTLQIPVNQLMGDSSSSHQSIDVLTPAVTRRNISGSQPISSDDFSSSNISELNSSTTFSAQDSDSGSSKSANGSSSTSSSSINGSSGNSSGSASSMNVGSGVVTLHSLFRGVLSTLVFMVVIAGGFGVVGMIHSRALEHRTQPVDPQRCTCDCFDGVMKGIYFTRRSQNPEAIEYKSLYVNHDFNAWIIICWITLYGGAIAKVCGKVNQVFWAGRLNWSAAAMLMPLILLFQYNFTSTLNYFNDRLYGPMYCVQLFFCSSSFVYAIAVYHLLDRQTRLPESYLLAALGVIFSHILIALSEQGWEHLLQWNTHLSLIARDGMFFLSDLVLFFYLSRQLSIPLLSLSSSSSASSSSSSSTSPSSSGPQKSHQQHRLIVFGSAVVGCYIAFKIAILIGVRFF